MREGGRLGDMPIAIIGLGVSSGSCPVHDYLLNRGFTYYRIAMQESSMNDVTFPV